MDNLPALKPFKPTFEINETTDFVEVKVTLKPRDKKRRMVTKVTDDDLRLFLEVSGVTTGGVVTRPSGAFDNQNSDSLRSGTWKFKKRDLRVKSTPPKAKTVRKTKTTSSKG